MEVMQNVSEDTQVQSRNVRRNTDEGATQHIYGQTLLHRNYIPEDVTALQNSRLG
jgi:hypothetical protein